MIKINRELNYEDVYLVPQKCIVESRSDCNIEVQLGKHKFRNPVIAANMKSVVNEETCRFFEELGMFYVYHRFDDDTIEFSRNMKLDDKLVSISIGIKERDRDIITSLKKCDLNPDFITIDVAHAHSLHVKDMINFIKHHLPESFLIVGNIATAEGVEYIQEAGADCLKVFIGPGRVCTTKIKTGFTRGTVTCLLECVQVAKVPIIADGGIRNSGDIAKAMAGGSTMVMAGSFMSGYKQNSGEIVVIDGHKKYIYYGSASYKNKGVHSHIEGTETILDYKGDMYDHIIDIESSLRSAISYAGVTAINDMHGTPMIEL